MSKEQTPKDFEAYLEQMGYSWRDFDHTYQIEGFVEQYAQYREKKAVLEALERELIDFHCGCMELGLKKDESVFIKSQWKEKVKAVAKEYYETEVKLKYKQINK